MVDNDKSTTKTNLSKIKILQVFVPWLKKESVSKNKFLQVLFRFLPWLKSNQYFILKISSTYQRRLINPFLQLQFWVYEIIALPILTFKFFLTFICQILSNKRCNWVKNIFYLMQHVLRGNQLCACLPHIALLNMVFAPNTRALMGVNPFFQLAIWAMRPYIRFRYNISNIIGSICQCSIYFVTFY
jgi:hypothetical protein